MKRETDITAIDLNRIDLEARRLRAQALADGMKWFWNWARNITNVGTGRTA